MNKNESNYDVRKHKLVSYVILLQFEVLPLESENRNLVYIPPGCRVKLRHVASVHLAYLAALKC